MSDDPRLQVSMNDPAKSVAINPAVDVRRLALPHTRARVTHTGTEPNPHAIKDRQGQFHVLQPGQSVEIEMVVDEIARFHELRKPGRMISRMTQIGEIYCQRMVEAPLHPLLVEEI